MNNLRLPTYLSAYILLLIFIFPVAKVTGQPSEERCKELCYVNNTSLNSEIAKQRRAKSRLKDYKSTLEQIRTEIKAQKTGIYNPDLQGIIALAANVTNTTADLTLKLLELHPKAGCISPIKYKDFIVHLLKKDYEKMEEDWKNIREELEECAKFKASITPRGQRKKEFGVLKETAERLAHNIKETIKTEEDRNNWLDELDVQLKNLQHKTKEVDQALNSADEMQFYLERYQAGIDSLCGCIPGQNMSIEPKTLLAYIASSSIPEDEGFTKESSVLLVNEFYKKYPSENRKTYSNLISEWQSSLENIDDGQNGPLTEVDLKYLIASTIEKIKPTSKYAIDYGEAAGLVYSIYPSKPFVKGHADGETNTQLAFQSLIESKIGQSGSSSAVVRALKNEQILSSEFVNLVKTTTSDAGALINTISKNDPNLGSALSGDFTFVEGVIEEELVDYVSNSISTSLGVSKQDIEKTTQGYALLSQISDSKPNASSTSKKELATNVCSFLIESEVIKVGKSEQAVVGMAMKYFTGNYIGLAQDLMGMGGKKRDDSFAMRQGFEAIGKQIAALQKGMHKRFDQLNEKLDTLSNQMNRRFDALDEAIKDVNYQLEILNVKSDRNYAEIRATRDDILFGRRHRTLEEYWEDVILKAKNRPYTSSVVEDLVNYSIVKSRSNVWLPPKSNNGFEGFSENLDVMKSFAASGPIEVSPFSEFPYMYGLYRYYAWGDPLKYIYHSKLETMNPNEWIRAIHHLDTQLTAGNIEPSVSESFLRKELIKVDKAGKNLLANRLDEIRNSDVLNILLERYNDSRLKLESVLEKKKHANRKSTENADHILLQTYSLKRKSISLSPWISAIKSERLFLEHHGSGGRDGTGRKTRKYRSEIGEKYKNEEQPRIKHKLLMPTSALKSFDYHLSDTVLMAQQLGLGEVIFRYRDLSTSDKKDCGSPRCRTGNLQLVVDCFFKIKKGGKKELLFTHKIKDTEKVKYYRDAHGGGKHKHMISNPKIIRNRQAMFITRWHEVLPDEFNKSANGVNYVSKRNNEKYKGPNDLYRKYESDLKEKDPSKHQVLTVIKGGAENKNIETLVRNRVAERRKKLVDKLNKDQEISKIVDELSMHGEVFSRFIGLLYPVSVNTNDLISFQLPTGTEIDSLIINCSSDSLNSYLSNRITNCQEIIEEDLDERNELPTELSDAFKSLDYWIEKLKQ